MYDKGKGVPKDYKTAVKWYRLAAEQGFADDQYNLGVMYQVGHCVLQDYVRAHMLFNMAAAAGYQHAFHNRDIVSKRMTPADISAAHKLARECCRKKYQDCG